MFNTIASITQLITFLKIIDNDIIKNVDWYSLRFWDGQFTTYLSKDTDPNHEKTNSTQLR